VSVLALLHVIVFSAVECRLLSAIMLIIAVRIKMRVWLVLLGD